jgi:hypothetical protein
VAVHDFPIRNCCDPRLAAKARPVIILSRVVPAQTQVASYTCGLCALPADSFLISPTAGVAARGIANREAWSAAQHVAVLCRC